MITSHRNRRALQNYGYFSRIGPFLPAQRGCRRVVLRCRRFADSGNRGVVVSEAKVLWAGFCSKAGERAFGVIRLFGARICDRVRFEQEGGPDLSAGAS
jgi:hypothetical protein